MTISDNMKKYGYFCAFSIMAIGVIYDFTILIVHKIEPASHYIVLSLSMITIQFSFLRMVIPDVLYFVIYYGFAFLIFRRIWLIIRLRKLSMPSTLTAPLWGIIFISLILIVISLAFSLGSLVLTNLFGGTIYGTAIAGILKVPALILLPIGIGSVEFFSLLFDRSSTDSRLNEISNDAS